MCAPPKREVSLGERKKEKRRDKISRSFDTLEHYPSVLTAEKETKTNSAPTASPHTALSPPQKLCSRKKKKEEKRHTSQAPFSIREENGERRKKQGEEEEKVVEKAVRGKPFSQQNNSVFISSGESPPATTTKVKRNGHSQQTPFKKPPLLPFLPTPPQPSEPFLHPPRGKKGAEGGIKVEQS